MSRGQSLVELAVCAPVLMLLAFGSVATVQVIEASSGLDIATRAAAAEAAAAPDAASAQKAAQARFAALIAGYPVHEAHLRIIAGGFSRADQVTAESSGLVDVPWTFGNLAGDLVLQSTCTSLIEPWRTRSVSP